MNPPTKWLQVASYHTVPPTGNGTENPPTCIAVDKRVLVVQECS